MTEPLAQPHGEITYPAAPHPAAPAEAPPGGVSPPALSTGPPRGSRLAWLDALRGIAALAVVFNHLSYHLLQPVREALAPVFDPGLYGVLVFFMVSGYIVPASLERKGSIRNFWISRIFRLFPLVAVAIAGVVVLSAFGYTGLSPAETHPAVTVLAHAFMLNDLLGVTNLITVLWTLSYEMVFYLLLTALFAIGAHRASGRFALAFATAALLLGGLLPMIWLSHSSLGRTKVALAADILVIGGLGVAVAARRLPRTLGALTAAATGLLLVAVNERVEPYEGLTILALMFTGTVLYRAEHGQLARRKAVIFTITVFAATIVAGAWHIPETHPGQDMISAQCQWIISLALAGATFAAAMMLRKKRVPPVLAWLGLVSFSVYLLHPLLLDVYVQIPWTQGPHLLAVQVVMAAGFLAVLLILCLATYHLVEVPMQRAGQRLAQRLDARFGPDHPAPSRWWPLRDSE